MDGDYVTHNNGQQNFQISGKSPTIGLSSRKRSGMVNHGHTQHNSISGPPDQIPTSYGNGMIRGPNPLQSQSQ